MPLLPLEVDGHMMHNPRIGDQFVKAKCQSEAFGVRVLRILNRHQWGEARLETLALAFESLK